MFEHYLTGLKRSFLKQAKTLLLVGTIVAAVLLGLKSYTLIKKSQAIKADWVELSSIKYGLFNVDEWKGLIAKIVISKVNELQITDENKDVMRDKVTVLLEKIIDEYEKRFYKDESGGLMGLFKKGGARMFGVFDDIKKDIPNLTNEILNFLEDDGNRAALSEFINTKMGEYADSTFAETDYRLHDALIAQYGQEDRQSTLAFMDQKIESMRPRIREWQIYLLALAVLVAVLLLLKGDYRLWDYTLFTVFAFVLLGLGLGLPMIDIDARISSLKFHLLGSEVEFVDQILFFKSKSILEVVTLMLTQGKFDVLLVGILVLSFSVLFPMVKLITTNLFIHVERLRSVGVVRFFVFKTGKWSMADVMVVAIFMAYIGFSGILGDQLRQLEKVVKSAEILTTNESTLQAGFFFFTAFAVIGILIVQKMDRQLGFKRKHRSEQQVA